MPWTRKYMPKSCSEVVAQDSALKQLKEFVSDYKKQKKKAVLIYGAVGSGKTCSVYALANDLGFEVVEVNASDFRNAEQINSLVGSASKQMSLFSKGKIILVDEVDGISGQEDRGGIAALTKLIEESGFPIVITANDPWDKKFSGLRRKCLMIEFSPLGFDAVFGVLKRVCKEENIRCGDDVLKTFAMRSGSDLRGAIIDLQIVASRGSFSKEDVEELSARRHTESIVKALVKVFKSTDFDVAIGAFENVEEDLEEVALWIDENLPLEYEKPEELARAYEALSLADVFNGRIRRQQHWRLLVYINALLSAGVAVAKDRKYAKFVSYKRTQRILKLWIANNKYNKRKLIAEKIAEKTHTSTRRAIQDTLPYLQLMIKNSKNADDVINYLDLDDEEVEWLRK